MSLLLLLTQQAASSPITLDSSAALPLRTAATLAVVVAADSSKSLPLATQATLSAIVAADSSQRLPLAESATVTLVDAVADSEALPLATTAVAQVLVAADSSKALPLSTSGSASLVITLDSASPLPLGQAVDMSVVALSITLDANSSLPLGTTASIQTVQGGLLRRFRNRKKKEWTWFEGRDFPAPVVQTAPTVEVAPEMAPARAIESSVRLPLSTVATVGVLKLVKPVPARAANSAQRLPLGARATLTAGPLQIVGESTQRLRLGTRAHLSLVSTTESVTALPLGSVSEFSIEEFAAITLDTEGVLPFRTTAHLEMEPVEPDESQSIDEELGIILLAYEFLEAA